jgi:excisionase family DNA binding protein
VRWRFFSKPIGLDLERCCAAGEGNNLVLLSFFIFTLNLKYRIMENPFEIIVKKLNVIEKRISSIEHKLGGTSINDCYKEVMNLNQLCDYLELSKSHIYKLTSNQEIPHYKRGGKKLYFNKYEIDNWLLQNKIVTRREIEMQAANYCIKYKFKF